MDEPMQVEIKVNLGGDVPTALDRLPLREPGTRVLYFLEGPPTATSRHPLLDAGVIVRLRADDDGGEVTVKLRPCRRRRLAGRWRRPAELDGGLSYSIEADWSGDRHVLAASLTGPITTTALLRALAAPASALGAEQLDLLRRCLPAPLDLTGLAARGPIIATRWRKFELDAVERVTAERWQVGDLDFLELSVRVPQPDARRVQARLLASLTESGLTPAAESSAKTQLVLDQLALSRV